MKPSLKNKLKAKKDLGCGSSGRVPEKKWKEKVKKRKGKGGRKGGKKQKGRKKGKEEEGRKLCDYTLASCVILRKLLDVSKLLV
jgi:hypothetical protein